MLLKHQATGKLVEVLGARDLFNPMHESIVGRFSVGEELQDPENFAKTDLVFCSDEPLPALLDRCPLPRRRVPPLLSACFMIVFAVR